MKIAIAAEALTDFKILCHLVDLTLLEQKWFCQSVQDGTSIDTLRQWESIDNQPFLKTSTTKNHLKKLRLTTYSKNLGKGVNGRALTTRRAFLVLKHYVPHADFYLFHNDTDGKLTHAQDMRQARNALTFHTKCVVAAPHPEMEAWLCSALQLNTPDAQHRHKKEKQRLGFDPITASHKLTANRKTDKKDAKRTFDTLCPNNPTPTDVLGEDLQPLYQNGEHNGLRHFIDEVREKLL